MNEDKQNISKASIVVLEALEYLNVDMWGAALTDDLQGTELAAQAIKLLPTTRSIIVLVKEIYWECVNLTKPEAIEETPFLSNIYDAHLSHLGEQLYTAAHGFAVVSRKAGLKALPMPAYSPSGHSKYLEEVISYNQAAQAAGLGCIGMSSRLVTYKYGPRIVMTLCLSEAELKSTVRDTSTACRFCNVCVAKCPSGALDYPEEGKVFAFNVYTCLAYNEAVSVCCECIRHCPVASPVYD